MIWFWIIELWLITTILGAKHYLFKTCEQLGFCHRHQHYSQSQSENEILNSYYFIDSFKIDNKLSIAHGEIIKKVPDGDIKLNYSIGVIQGGGVRFTLDQDRSNLINNKDILVNSERFAANKEFQINYTKLSNVEFNEFSHGWVLSFNNTKVILDKDFDIKVMVSDKLKLHVNRQHLLNFEHHRSANQENQLLPEETDFNMFQDTFKDLIDDKLPLGPESIGLDFTFTDTTNLYGIPEHSDLLKLKSQMYRLFNVDIFEYEINSTLPMYGSIPFVIAMSPELSTGLFWINSADTYINVNIDNDVGSTSTHWMSESGIMDFVVFTGSPQEINQQYSEITGFTSLPPIFSLGYHQCRWNYNDEQDVLQINEYFDKFEIPYDTIWLDIEYADGKKYFTWSPSSFPQPEKLLAELDHTGRNLVIIIDPHIKTGYEISNELIKNKLTIMNNNNKTYKGHCWPGESVWVDSFNPNVREYWDKLHSLNGEFMTPATNIHLWNDMNEISVFDGPETSSPRDNLHYGGWEDRSVHNLNGKKFHELTYDSLILRQQETNRQRPFILTRLFYSGSQTSAAMWTGDNMSKWEYLKISIPMVLNNGLSGMPFAGADVGGFFGDPLKELLTRWYQTGIFYPFFRAHAHIDSRRREPWVPGEPFTSYIRDAIRLRYSFLPIFYTSFYKSSITGLPVLKPIFYDFQKFYDIEDEFFIGDSGILAKPVTEPDVILQKIIVPDDEVYYHYTNGEVGQPAIMEYDSSNEAGTISIPVTLGDIPMVVRGGHIIATQPRYRRSTKLMINDPYTITIFLSKNGNAKGELYIDDGESFNYLKGKYLLLELTADDKNFEIQVKNNWEVEKSVDKIIVIDSKGLIKQYNKNISLNNSIKLSYQELEKSNSNVEKELSHDEL